MAVTYRDGLLAFRRSPIKVLTGLDVELNANALPLSQAPLKQSSDGGKRRKSFSHLSAATMKQVHVYVYVYAICC